MPLLLSCIDLSNYLDELRSPRCQIHPQPANLVATVSLWAGAPGLKNCLGQGDCTIDVCNEMNWIAFICL